MSDNRLGPLLGAGKEAEVYAWGDDGRRVAKLYKSGRPKQTAFREAATTALVESRGLPCPRVWGVEPVGDRWAVIMDRAPGEVLLAAMRRETGRREAHLSIMARLHGAIHERRGVPLLPLRQRLVRDIRRAQALDDGQRTKLLAALAAMPEGDALCHGDFHPMNIIGPPGGEVVLDWVDAVVGDPAADVCRSYLLIRTFEPAMAEAYTSAYVATRQVDRAAIFAWLPFVAAARLAEGVPQEEAALLALVGAAGFAAASPHGG